MWIVRRVGWTRLFVVPYVVSLTGVRRPRTVEQSCNTTVAACPRIEILTAGERWPSIPGPKRRRT